MMKKAKAEAEAKSGKVFRCGFCDTPGEESCMIGMSTAKVVCGQAGKREEGKKFCSRACAYAWIRDFETPNIVKELGKCEQQLEPMINQMGEAILQIKIIKDSLENLEKDFADGVIPDRLLRFAASLTIKNGGVIPSAKEVKKIILENLTHNLAAEETTICVARECKVFIKYRKAILSRQPRAVLEVLRKQLLDIYGEILENFMIMKNEKKTYDYSTRISIEQGDVIIDSFCRN